MFVRNIISFAGSWETVNQKFPQELAELSNAIENLTIENIVKAVPKRGIRNGEDENKVTPWKLDGCWCLSLEEMDWIESREYLDNLGSRPIYLRSLGHIKNRVSVSLQRHREILNRWMFTLAPIATKNNLIDIPIAVVPLRGCEDAIFGFRGAMRASFETTQDELVALSPLSHNTPFLILGVSLEAGRVEITELESESNIAERQIIINRSIEFPPEYHHAGIGILNYFGTVLREKYPDEKAKVKIEQDGFTVRMIVESANGNREIIEKALQEYEMVIRGDALPEALFESKLHALELRNELRIAQMRIESQRDLIEHKNLEICTLKQLFGHALTQNTSPAITLTVSPVINVSSTQSNSIAITNDFSCLMEQMQELTEMAKLDPSMEMRLLDLEESVKKASQNSSTDAVKESSGLKKLKKFIEEATETGSTVNKFINNVSDGIGYVQGLARKYNSIASWCGAPQVPEILLGSKS